MFTSNLLPGHGFQSFTAHKKKTNVGSTGRPKATEYDETDVKFLGALIRATQKEIDQWKQNGHPITHKITEFSALAKARATDYLISEDGRQFYIQGIKNPGDLNVTMIYYVEERYDVKKKTVCI